jgi:CheY-like chemotaxis protein
VLQDRPVLIATGNHALSVTIAWMTEVLGCKARILELTKMPEDVIGPIESTPSSVLIFDLDIYDLEVGGEMLAPVLEYEGEDQGVILLGKLGAANRLRDVLPQGDWVALSKPVLLSRLTKALLDSVAAGAQRKSGKGRKGAWAENQPLAQKRVLVAEDNKVNQIVVKRILENLGAVTTIVDDGAQAVKKIKKSKFDLLLMDLHMPELDGIQATTAIRAWEKGRKSKGKSTARVPIIALTADIRDAQMRECLKVGMDDFLNKPLEQEKLFSVVRKWFD